MTLRLFAAIALPDEIKDRIAPLQRGVAGAAWRARESLHLTLRFFGEIDETFARQLDDELALVRAGPFELTLKSAGWFGGAEPHAVWLGVEESVLLTTLAQRCERAARRAGLAAETRKFVPHVTLAYCRGTPPEEAARFAARLALFQSAPFLVDRFGLFSSWPSKLQNRYALEAQYPLVGAEAGAR